MIRRIRGSVFLGLAMSMLTACASQGGGISPTASATTPSGVPSGVSHSPTASAATPSGIPHSPTASVPAPSGVPLSEQCQADAAGITRVYGAALAATCIADGPAYGVYGYAVLWGTNNELLASIFSPEESSKSAFEGIVEASPTNQAFTLDGRYPAAYLPASNSVMVLLGPSDITVLQATDPLPSGSQLLEEAAGYVLPNLAGITWNPNNAS